MILQDIIRTEPLESYNPALVQDAEAEEEMARWEHWDFEDGFEREINITSNELGRHQVF